MTNDENPKAPSTPTPLRALIDALPRCDALISGAQCNAPAAHASDFAIGRYRCDRCVAPAHPGWRFEELPHAPALRAAIAAEVAQGDGQHPAVLAFAQPRGPAPVLTAEQQAKLEASREKVSAFTPEAEFFGRFDGPDGAAMKERGARARRIAARYAPPYVARMASYGVCIVADSKGAQVADCEGEDVAALLCSALNATGGGGGRP